MYTDSRAGHHTAPFERAEYEGRLRRVRERMDEGGFDALFLADPANMNYLTGYDGWSFYVHQGVVVTPEGAPVWVGREMDARGAHITTWLPGDHVRPYDDDHVQSSAGRHPMDHVAEVLRDLGLARARLGVEMDAYYYTARSHQRLRDALPDASFDDATLLVNRVRMVKSEREIEYMKRAGRLAEEGMRRGLEALGEGVPESRVAAAIYQGLIGGTDGLGGEYPAIVPLMPTGDRSGTPHLTWSDRPLRPGPVIIELAGAKHRYHAPLARTAHLGAPPPAVRRTTEAVLEGLEAALEAVAPGVTAASVERAWRRTIARKGLEKPSRLGYSCGLGYPPDWGEHTVSLRPDDRTVLEPDMTFHMIPGIWLDDHGVEISETFRVTESGSETLSRFPRELFEV